MNNLIQRFIKHLDTLYPDPIRSYQSRAILIPSIAGLSFILVPFIYQILSGTTAETSADFQADIFSVALGLGLLLSPTLLVLRGNLNWARAIFTLGAYALAVLNVAIDGIFSLSIVYLILATLYTSILYGRLGVIIGAIVSIIISSLLGNLELTGVLETTLLRRPETLANFGNLLQIAGALILTAALIWLATGNLHKNLAQIQRTATQLRTISDIAQSANASVQDPKLLNKLVETIREQLKLYHVQVFLIDDEQRNAVLVASTGTAGQQLLARGHSLPVGSRSVIGQVTRRGQVVYATDTSSDPTHKANEFLPGTRAELALPLNDGHNIIGALDVQSTEANPFSPEDIDSLRIMANQIAVAIRNANMFDQLEHTAQDNQRLYEQAQATLRDVEHLNRQLTGQAWEDFLGSSSQQYGIEITDGAVNEKADWTPLLTQALQTGKPILEGRRLAVPLDIRGHVLGATEIELPQHIDSSEAEELVEAVMARLALAMDNNRLFEETQALAMQEYLVNQVGGHLQTSTEIDDMLRLTLNELTTALGAQSAAIRLRPALAGAGDDLA